MQFTFFHVFLARVGWEGSDGVPTRARAVAVTMGANMSVGYKARAKAD